MPELPEVETVRRTLDELIVGARITKVWWSGVPLRMNVPLDEAELKRASRGELVRARRRAKYLLLDVRDGARTERSLLVHLGMSGRMLVKPAADERPLHTHVVWTLADGRELRFVDPRRFGVVRALRLGEEATAPELVDLGIEPFDAGFTAAHLHALARRQHRPLKTFLLDQKTVVGVGNIYASEALWLAGLHPHKRASTLSLAAAATLRDAIVTTLGRAIEHKGTTLRSYVDAFGETGWNQLSLAVYGREGEACPRCGAKVRAAVTQGRASFYCAACQKR